MKKMAVLTILITLIANGCETVDFPKFIEKTSVQKITISKNENLTVGFNATILWFSSCGSYDHYEKTVNGDDVYITVYGSQLSNALCDEGFYSFKGTFEVSIENSGPHHFHFWQTDAITLDTLINVLD